MYSLSPSSKSYRSGGPDITVNWSANLHIAQSLSLSQVDIMPHLYYFLLLSSMFHCCDQENHSQQLYVNIYIFLQSKNNSSNHYMQGFPQMFDVKKGPLKMLYNREQYRRPANNMVPVGQKEQRTQPVSSQECFSQQHPAVALVRSHLKLTLEPIFIVISLCNL